MIYAYDYDSSFVPAMPVVELNQFIVTLNGLASVVEISQ